MGEFTGCLSRIPNQLIDQALVSVETIRRARIYVYALQGNVPNSDQNP